MEAPHDSIPPTPINALVLHKVEMLVSWVHDHDARVGATLWAHCCRVSHGTKSSGAEPLHCFEVIFFIQVGFNDKDGCSWSAPYALPHIMPQGCDIGESKPCAVAASAFCIWLHSVLLLTRGRKVTLDVAGQ